MAIRTLDLVVATIAFAVFLPVMAIVALLIWLESPRSEVIYKGTRIGRFAKPFTLYKFRTMVQDASRIGPAVTTSDDPRITRLGRVLRRTKLDELLSLWNVLKGEMSLVGPRPENEQSFALYTAEQRAVVDVRPGITSLATIKYRNEEQLLAGAVNLDAVYYEVMQDKLYIELEYLKRRNLLSDVGVLLSTVLVIANSDTSQWVLSWFGMNSTTATIANPRLSSGK